MSNPGAVFRLAATVMVIASALPAANEPAAIPLWPGGPPDSAISHESAETITNRDTEQNNLGMNRSLDFVSEPSVKVFPAPAETATGAAVVIFPGGGFTHLAIDKEGYDIARRLNAAGITGIVVKYRTRTADAEPEVRARQMRAILSDGLRAVRLARFNAAGWGIDPKRIGVIGFSAGGYLAAAVAVNGDSGLSAAVDPVERVSSRPDFAAMIYPAMPPDFKSLVNESSPPMFFVNAADDQTTPVPGCLAMFEAARSAGVRAELHVFDNGGHGFGLGVRGGAVARWPELLEEWLKETGMVQDGE